MSPQRPRRKPYRDGSGPRGARPGKHRPRPNALYAEMLRASRELLAVRSPLDAELMVSELLGTWWGQRLRRPVGDIEEIVGEGLVDYAAEAGTPAALALLAGIAYLGTPRQAAMAERAALALIERGVARPRWADRVGAVAPGECYVNRDAFGDRDEIICTFTYAGEDRHALIAVVDYNMRGMLRDAWVTAKVDRLLEHCRQLAGGEPGGTPDGAPGGAPDGAPDVPAGQSVVFEPLEPGRARTLLQAGLEETDRSSDAAVNDSFPAYHAFVRARVRTLPPGRRRGPVRQFSRDRRAMLAAGFLASGEAEELSDPGAASRCADIIIDYGCDHDFGRPLRVSPLKAETFLLDWLPRKVMLGPAEQDAMPLVLAAWTRWASKRTELPERAVRQTLDAVWEATGKFTEAYRDPTTFGLDRDLVERLLPDSDLEALPRRAFAFPVLCGRRGGVRLDGLNPADPADRRVLLTAEHTGPDADHDPGPGLDDHLRLHERVATRLWTSEPPELWEAAQRLLDLGHDRHAVLHMLMDVLDRMADDEDELPRALDELPTDV